MPQTTFAGDKKKGQSILGGLERRFIDFVVPKIPSWISSDALTYSTIWWSIMLIAFGYLAASDSGWLWGMSAAIFLQWLTDSLDGSLGKYRHSGLVHWGYYMDHFLDYIFLCSILIGYSLMLPDYFKYLLFFAFAIFGAFMVSSYLSFAATNEFQISYFGIGPTEIRIVFIIVNTLLFFFGKTHLAFTLPYILPLSFIGLCIMVYRTSKYIRVIDMENKLQESLPTMPTGRQAGQTGKKA